MKVSKVILPVVLGLVFGMNNALSQTAKPNILILIGDDISYNDFSCTGSKIIKTPNIDQLAKNGIIFNNAYLTASSCSPSRVSILTGRYPHNTGAAELHSAVPANQLAFPKILKENGYYTAQAGKWHFGESGAQPKGLFLNAFDRVGGSQADAGGPGGENRWVEYLKQRPKNKPFFMWFAAHDAHREWDDEDKPVKYHNADIRVPSNLVDTRATRMDLASYYEEVSRFDHYIGKVMDELKAQGVLDNTLIIVMADNGRPFPRNKTRMYDEGIKTPFVVHMPGRNLQKGRTSSSMLSVIDIAPTVLDLAGIKSPPNFQGKSFKKIIEQPNVKFRNYAFAEHNWHSFKAYERMVRNDHLVYIENGLPELNNMGATDIMGGAAGMDLKKEFLDGRASTLQSAIFITPQPRYELYDYKKDPDQLNNLYGRKEFQAEQEKLASILKIWKRDTGDDQPTDLTPDWYDRWSNKALGKKGNRGQMPGFALQATTINKPGPF